MRSIYGLALASAALSSLSAMSAMEGMGHIIAMPQAPSSGVPNYHRKIRSSRYVPHQSKRECARRIRQGLCPA